MFSTLCVVRCIVSVVQLCTDSTQRCTLFSAVLAQLKAVRCIVSVIQRCTGSAQRCALYSQRCSALYWLSSVLYAIRYALHSQRCTGSTQRLYAIRYALHSQRCTGSTQRCTLYAMRCIVSIVLDQLSVVRYTLCVA